MTGVKPRGPASNIVALLGPSCPWKPVAAYFGTEPKVPDAVLCPGFQTSGPDHVCRILLQGYHGARLRQTFHARSWMVCLREQSCHFMELTEQAPRPGFASSLVNICRCDSSLRLAFIVTTCLIDSGVMEQTHLPLSLCDDPQPWILTRAWWLWMANLSQVGHNINNLKNVSSSFSFFFFLATHAACRILVPRPGIELGPLAVKAQSPKHRTTREFQKMFLLDLPTLQQSWISPEGTSWKRGDATASISCPEVPNPTLPQRT